MYVAALVAILLSLNLRAETFKGKIADLEALFFISQNKVEFNLEKVNQLHQPSATRIWLVKFKSLNQSYCLSYTFAGLNQKAKLLLHSTPNCDLTIKPKTIVEDYQLIEFRSDLILLANGNNQKRINLLRPNNLLFKDLASKTKTSIKKITPPNFCQKYNEQCELVVDLDCNECEDGFELVAAGACPTQMDRQCGKSRCGGKHERACPRGKFFHQSQQMAGCVNNTPAAYCQEGLLVFCQDDRLICL
jgi:hypothetical protein